MLTLWIIKKGLKLSLWVFARVVMLAVFVPTFICMSLGAFAESLIKSK